jgi:predicted nucleic acid-binding protein
MTTTAADPQPGLHPALTALKAGDRVFVDTNIWVYATTASAPLHPAAQAALAALTVAGAELWTSRQVLREYAATLTRPQPFSQPQPAPAVIAAINGILTQCRVAEDGPSAFGQFLTLLAAVPCGGRQVYDANIAATMLAHGVPNLLTHNTADFSRFGGYIAVIPLVP